MFGFNVVTQLWSDLPRFTKDRGYHGITSFGGQLYVTGGYCNVNSETLDLGNLASSAVTGNKTVNTMTKQVMRVRLDITDDKEKRRILPFVSRSSERRVCQLIRTINSSLKFTL